MKQEQYLRLLKVCCSVTTVEWRSKNCAWEVPRAAAGLGLRQAMCCSLLCTFMKAEDKASSGQRTRYLPSEASSGRKVGQSAPEWSWDKCLPLLEPSYTARATADEILIFFAFHARTGSSHFPIQGLKTTLTVIKNISIIKDMILGWV